MISQAIFAGATIGELSVPVLNTTFINTTLINNTTPVINEFAITMSTVMNTIQFLMGGLFGFYVLTFIYRLINDRKIHMEMKKLFNEIAIIKKKIEKIEKKK